VSSNRHQKKATMRRDLFFQVFQKAFYTNKVHHITLEEMEEYRHGAMKLFLKSKYKPETPIERGLNMALKSTRFEVRQHGKVLPKREQQKIINKYLSGNFDSPNQNGSNGDGNNGDNGSTDGNGDGFSKNGNILPITRSCRMTVETVFERMKNNKRYRRANDWTNEMIVAIGLKEYEAPFEKLFDSVELPEGTEAIPEKFQKWLDLPALDSDSGITSVNIAKFLELSCQYDDPFSDAAKFFEDLRSVCMCELETKQENPLESKEVETMNLARDLLWKVAEYGPRVRENKAFIVSLTGQSIDIIAKPDFTIFEKRDFDSSVVAIGAVEVKRYTMKNLVGQPAFEALACSTHNLVRASIRNEQFPSIIPIIRFNGPYVSVSLYHYPLEYIVGLIKRGETIRGKLAPVAIHLSNNNRLGFNMLVKGQRELAFRLLRQVSAFTALPVEERNKHAITNLSKERIPVLEHSTIIDGNLKA
jgi:hypothetical protein